MYHCRTSGVPGSPRSRGTIIFKLHFLSKKKLRNNASIPTPLIPCGPLWIIVNCGRKDWQKVLDYYDQGFGISRYSWSSTEVLCLPAFHFWCQFRYLDMPTGLLLKSNSTYKYKAKIMLKGKGEKYIQYLFFTSPTAKKFTRLIVGLWSPRTRDLPTDMYGANADSHNWITSRFANSGVGVQEPRWGCGLHWHPHDLFVY